MCTHSLAQQGELDVARVRLAALEADRRKEQQGSAELIATLEARVKDGEVQRRKMHNLIQEVRGAYNKCLQSCCPNVNDAMFSVNPACALFAMKSAPFRCC